MIHNQTAGGYNEKAVFCQCLHNAYGCRVYGTGKRRKDADV
jgi:hypothetical protein